MSARKAKFSESSLLLSWLKNTESNCFDESVLDYPTCEVLVAPEESPTSCLPIHLTVTLESLGHAPESDAKQRLLATLDCLRLAAEKAKGVGAKELYYIASDGRIDERAEKLGFKRVWCYRMKI
jgi:hypothetical protein